MVSNEKIVTIFGSGKLTGESSTLILAEKIGRLLAQHGYTIANGGYAGTMLAAAKGATEENGKVIGVTCSAFRKSSANEYVTEEVVTNSLEQRVKTLTEMADAYVILPGATGTLLELANVWELKNKKFLAYEKPIVLMGTYWKGLIDLMAGTDPECLRCIQTANNPEQLVQILQDTFALQPKIPQS